MEYEKEEEEIKQERTNDLFLKKTENNPVIHVGQLNETCTGQGNFHKD